MKKIRLGIVRADTHAYYFGIMLDRCDPLLLQKYNYVCHHYASSIYQPDLLTFPKVAGFEIAAVYDSNIAAAGAFSETFYNKPIVCEKIDDMIGKIDAVFIADCDGSGSDHLKLAEPFLTKGIPTYVDKPFASRLDDAKAIVKLANKHKTLMFNASILSYVPVADHFKQRFGEIASTYYPVPAQLPSLPFGLGMVKGVGGAFSQELSGKAVSGGIEDRMAYIIHGVSLALNLFGKDIEWVEAMGTLPLEYLHLHTKSGIEIMIMNTSVDIFPETCSFYASAYSKFGAIHSGPIGDPEFIGGGQRILEVFKKMMKTGIAPVAYEEFILHIAVIEAGQAAQKKGTRVYVKDIWKP
jgi:hypothetical protein